jgi:hypothetical protein
MDEQITYFAIINDFSSRERPGGVVRRVKHDGGQRDEAFTGELRWEHTSLLYSAERSDLTNKLCPISEEEALQIVERIRREARPHE